jgi:hypothetical protein
MRSHVCRKNSAIIAVGIARVPPMIAKLLLQNTVFVIAMGRAAVRLRRHAALARRVDLSDRLGGDRVRACGFWLARVDPGLLAERMRLTAREGQPAADKRFVLVFVVVAVLWFVAMGLDRRFDGADAGVPLIVLGLCAVSALDRAGPVGCSAPIRLPPRS